MSPERPAATPDAHDCVATLIERIERVAALVKQIEDAFAQREYPGDNSLGVWPDPYDEEHGTGPVAFRGKHWREVSVETLVRQSEVLSFFTSRAFRFYLPAFLIACLTVDPEVMDVVPGHLVGDFTPPRHRKERANEARARFEDRVGALTDAERSAVKAWLEYMISHDPDIAPRRERKSLVAHWQLKLQE